MFTLEMKQLRTPLFVVLALAACELPVKVGDLPTAGDSDTAEPDTGEATVTGSTGEATTGEPSACATLSEGDCAADPACAPLIGRRYTGNACLFEPEAFIVCHDADLACTPEPSTVCRDADTFEIDVTCEPPGLTACEPPADDCGQPDCMLFDEPTCLAQDVCKPVYGNPHLGVDTPEECVDDATTAYLGCISDAGACPPFIPTVCPEDAPDERYDVPAGCIPPHFVMCGGEGLPAC